MPTRALSSLTRYSGSYFSPVLRRFVTLTAGQTVSMENRNARLGIGLFVVYLVLYGAYVFLNAFSAQTMEITPFAGVNLAILFGFGLNIAALVLALLYGALCDAGDTTDQEKEADL